MRRLVLLALLAALALAAACSNSDSITSADITGTLNWAAPYSAKYRVLDSNDDEVGTLELTIKDEPHNVLVLRQFFDFPKKKFTNEARVTVDATTLQPQSTIFKIVGPDGNLDCSATYETGKVSAHRVGQDTTRDDIVNVPGLAYDSWGDLFVWSTLPFDKGYEKDYTDVLSCTLAKTDRIGVKLSVKDKEQITVPAGTYDTWKLKIQSGGDTQTAWYTTDAKHTLVKYDNGESTFELTSSQ